MNVYTRNRKVTSMNGLHTYYRKRAAFAHGWPTTATIMPRGRENKHLLTPPKAYTEIGNTPHSTDNSTVNYPQHCQTQKTLWQNYACSRSGQCYAARA